MILMVVIVVVVEFTPAPQHSPTHRDNVTQQVAYLLHHLDRIYYIRESWNPLQNDTLKHQQMSDIL